MRLLRPDMGMLERLRVAFSERQAKRSIRSRLDRLVDEIAEKNRIVETGSQPIPPSAQQHLDKADADYRQALAQFQEEDLDECNRYAERAEIHLKLAEVQLAETYSSSQALSLAESGVEGTLAQLSKAIVDTKLAIEYSNCNLSAQTRKGLINVTARFGNALELLKDGESEEAQGMAEAGLLRLYWYVVDLCLENRHTIVDLRLSKKSLSKLGWQLKEFVDRAAECKQRFYDVGKPLPPAVGTHLAGADQAFRNAIDCVIDNDDSGLEACLAAGSLELKTAEKLFQSSGASEKYEEESAPIAVRPSSSEYEANVDKLKRLIESSQTQNGDQVIKRLSASARYFRSALEQLAAGDRVEASRLSRAAYLDLDYARQLALSNKPAKYLDI